MDAPFDSSVAAMLSSADGVRAAWRYNCCCQFERPRTGVEQSERAKRTR